MGIKLQQRTEFDAFDVGIPGTITAAQVSSTIILVPFPLTLKGIFATLGTAGVTGNSTFDILKNGVSIFASGTITFATTSTVATYGPFTAGATSFVKGDIIKIKNLTIAATPPVDFALALNFARVRGSQFSIPPQTGTVGIDAE